MRTLFFIILSLPIIVNAQKPKFGLASITKIEYSSNLNTHASIDDSCACKHKLQYIIKHHIMFIDTQPFFWINKLERANFIKLPSDTLSHALFSVIKSSGTELKIYGRYDILVGRALFYKCCGNNYAYMITYENKDSSVFSLDYKISDISEVYEKIDNINLKLINNLMQEHWNK